MHICLHSLIKYICIFIPNVVCNAIALIFWWHIQNGLQIWWHIFIALYLSVLFTFTSWSNRNKFASVFSLTIYSIHVQHCYIHVFFSPLFCATFVTFFFVLSIQVSALYMLNATNGKWYNLFLCTFNDKFHWFFAFCLLHTQTCREKRCAQAIKQRIHTYA